MKGAIFDGKSNMRLVFQQFPWVHAPAPHAFKPLFLRFGHRETLMPGQAIYNGGVDAEVAFILSGLCTYRMQDARDGEHYLTLACEGRLASNVDGFTGDVVNILDYALRPTEVLLINRRAFLDMLAADPVLEREHMQMLVSEHESDMEGMFSALTDPLPVRLAKLLAALVFRNEPRGRFDWRKAKATITPEPIPYALTVTESAKVVCASRTAVSLCMSEWEKDGLLLRRNGTRLLTPALLDLIPGDWLDGRDPVGQNS